MLSRRTFVTALAAVSAMFGMRPNMATATATTHPGMPSDNLTRLANLWDAAACNFDIVRQAVLFPVSGVGRGEPHAPDSREMRRYREAGDIMLAYADHVFREPSRVQADVLLKYDIMGMLVRERHVHDVDAVRAAGGADWHLIVEREAQQFGLDLHPFWRWEFEAYA